MRHPEYVIVSVIALAVILISSPWHIQTGNVATICFILWTALGNICNLVNAAVWSGNVIDYNPGWCDFCESYIVAGLVRC